jgi:Sugar (and other) transporter
MAHPNRTPTGLGMHSPFWNIFPTRITVSATDKINSTSGSQTLGCRRHLLGTGRKDEARQVVADLNGVPLDDGLVDDIVEELEFAIKAENEGGKATWMECFSTRNNLWKRTVNGMMLQFIQQLNGQNFYCMRFLTLYYTSPNDLFSRLLRRYLLPERRNCVRHVAIIINASERSKSHQPQALTPTPFRLSWVAFLLSGQFLHWLVKLLCSIAPANLVFYSI